MQKSRNTISGEAARLRQRKFTRLRQFPFPEYLSPGSLPLTHRRCGKPTCYCASGEGHPIRFLTFMPQGKHRVERIPDQWVDDVRRRVHAGRAFLLSYPGIKLGGPRHSHLFTRHLLGQQFRPFRFGRANVIVQEQQVGRFRIYSLRFPPTQRSSQLALVSSRIHNSRQIGKLRTGTSLLTESLGGNTGGGTHRLDIGAKEPDTVISQVVVSETFGGPPSPAS